MSNPKVVLLGEDGKPVFGQDTYSLEGLTLKFSQAFPSGSKDIINAWGIDQAALRTASELNSRGVNVELILLQASRNPERVAGPYIVTANYYARG